MKLLSGLEVTSFRSPFIRRFISKTCLLITLTQKNSISVIQMQSFSMITRYLIPWTHPNVTVASYEMNYGKGKILMTSLFAHNLDNDREFFKFFKTVILPRAIGSVYKINLNGSSHDIYGLGYIPTGRPSLQPHHDIVIPINRSMAGNSMILDIPRQTFFNIRPSQARRCRLLCYY